MNIKLHNMGSTRVFKTSGPSVDFVLADIGQTNVSISLRLSDGTVFHYPKGMGKSQTESTLLPPGDYRCVVTVSAADMGTFGSTYDSVLTIGGKKAVSTSGAIPPGQDVDQDFELFVLRVA
jgi:hypothetical protein